MELTELQKVQILQLIHFAEVEAKQKGLNVKYITKKQMKDVLPVFFKFNHTEAVEQIQSLTDIASQLHKELTTPKPGTFERYDKMRESIKSFDWAAHHVSKDEPEKKG